MWYKVLHGESFRMISVHSHNLREQVLHMGNNLGGLSVHLDSLGG